MKAKSLQDLAGIRDQIAQRERVAREQATKRAEAQRRADEALTQTLKAALALIDVRVLDHVIVAPGDALSMAEKGLL